MCPRHTLSASRLIDGDMKLPFLPQQNSMFMDNHEGQEACAATGHILTRGATSELVRA